MKKWTKLAIPIVVVAVVAAWYAFRPERLVVNRRVDEAMPTVPVGPSPQPLVPDSSIASCTRWPVRQPSTGWEMALVFFALRTSPHHTALMCTSTWSPLTMQRTQRR